MACAALAAPRATPPRKPVNPFRARPVAAVPLADLQGPAEGTVRLPLALCWSLPDPTFDLADAADARHLYQTVLQSARGPAQLTPYLNARLLTEMWPDLRQVLRRVAPAWEARNPVLRDAVSAA